MNLLLSQIERHLRFSEEYRHATLPSHEKNNPTILREKSRISRYQNGLLGTLGIFLITVT
jgi:hypothetical protein